MTASSAGQRLRSLLVEEPVGGADHEVLGPLERLCRVAGRELDAAGVGVSLMWGEEGRVLIAASGPATARLEEVQFLVGEGPCRKAWADQRPVLVPDLSVSSRFPLYRDQAQALGVRAAFAFPIWEADVCVGIVDAYRTRAIALDAAQADLATAVAAAAQELLAGIQARGEDTRQVIDELTLDTRDDMFMAQGMVMVQLRCGQAEAMSRLRAAALASDRTLSEVARAVLAREVVFDVDR